MKTLDDIFNEKQNIFIELNIPQNEHVELHTKLKLYKVADELCDIIEGYYVRYINNETKKLYHGGIVLSLDINDNETGCIIKCKNVVNNKIFCICIKNNIVFQKISADELLILTFLTK
jgi:hypothetical protein